MGTDKPLTVRFKKVMKPIKWNPKISLDHRLISYREWFKKSLLNL